MATALQIQSYGVSTPIKSYTKKERLPEYHCSSCDRCTDNHCDFFNRHVEPDYNRCFSHTNYVKTPDIHYVSPPNSYFKQVQAEEARKIKELQKQGKNIGFI